MTPAQIAEIRQQLSDVRAWCAELEHKLDRAAVAPAAQPLTDDEIIASASSATQIYKALERELGVDRRTILARAERLVRAHALVERIPDWSTNVQFARYLADRIDGGERRIVVALRELDARPLGVEAGA